MNRARQDSITTEIMEIVGGSEALRSAGDTPMTSLIRKQPRSRTDDHRGPEVPVAKQLENGRIVAIAGLSSMSSSLPTRCPRSTLPSR